jgi:hypothetical protein
MGGAEQQRQQQQQAAAPVQEDAPLWGGGEGEAPLLGDFESISLLGPQELSNTLYAMARAAHPAPELFAAAASAVLRQKKSSGPRRHGAPVLLGWSTQDVCNTMWAYAAVDSRQIELMELCEEALRFRPDMHLDRVHHTQIQQWALWWGVEMGRPLNWMSAELRQACRASMAAGDEQRGHTISMLQRDVERALDRLMLPTVSEHTAAEGYSIDLAIPEQLVAIEVDGPHHFTQQRTATGATLLKRRQLCALGWRFVAVPYFEWEALGGVPASEVEYLRRALVAVGVHIHGITYTGGSTPTATLSVSTNHGVTAAFGSGSSTVASTWQGAASGPGAPALSHTHFAAHPSSARAVHQLGAYSCSGGAWGGVGDASGGGNHPPLGTRAAPPVARPGASLDPRLQQLHSRRY